MAGLKYTFIWQNEKGNIILPVRVEKSYSKDFGLKASLICPYCYEQYKQAVQMKQYYICEDGHKYTKGEIPYRMDKETGVVFKEEERKAFIEQSIKKEIKIHEEIELQDLWLNVEFFEDYMEIYSDDFNEILSKIHKYLAVKQKGLLATIGYRGKERGAIIIPVWNKLLLVFLRDYRLIKKAKGDVEELQNNLLEKLKAYSEDKTADLYMEFIEKIQNGEKIEVKTEARRQEASVNVDWLEKEMMA